jgi:hypothetical protein
MMQAAGSSDCPCCAQDKACPPEYCVAKCFPFVGAVQPGGIDVRRWAIQLRPPRSALPLDWSSQPQPPPPRT